MDQEKRELRHQLKNAEQEKLALKGLVKRAADELDDLAEADCSEEAIDNAKAQAERFERSSAPKLSSDSRPPASARPACMI